MSAVFNLFTGMGGLACGGAATAVGIAGGQAIRAHGKQDQRVEEKLRRAQHMGGAMMGYGLFLLAVTGLQIAGSVQLFRARSQKFVFLVALLTLVGEGVGAALTGFKPLLNGVGIVAALLAGIAVATSYVRT